MIIKIFVCYDNTRIDHLQAFQPNCSLTSKMGDQTENIIVYAKQFITALLWVAYRLPPGLPGTSRCPFQAWTHTTWSTVGHLIRTDDLT
jgi:hypothetical protein